MHAKKISDMHFVLQYGSILTEKLYMLPMYHSSIEKRKLIEDWQLEFQKKMKDYILDVNDSIIIIKKGSFQLVLNIM